MVDLIIGLAVSSVLVYIIFICRERGIKIRWYQWFLLSLEAIFIVFWLEVIWAFLKEGSPKGALVNGVLMGFFVSVFGVLLYRFIFKARLAGKKVSE